MYRNRPLAIALVLASLSGLLAAACTQQQLTGAMEEEELYNTNGVEPAVLFADAVAPVAVAAHPFVRVGLMWDAQDTTRLQGRIQRADGSWSAWRDIEPRFSEDGFHTSHLDLQRGQGQAFQLRLAAGPPPAFLLVEAIDQVGEPQPALPAQPAERFGKLKQALAPASLVHRRADWGARAPRCNSGGHSPSTITIHHTATPLPDTVSVTTRLRGIQNYHMDTRGWCDIGYHYLVDWNGEIWQGRPETTIGAHVLNHNTNNVGISFMGTYNDNEPSAGQINHAAELIDWLSSTYGIAQDRAHVRGHREYRGTNPGDCPGDRIYARMDELVGDGSADNDPGGDPGDDPGDDPVDPGSGLIQGVVFVDQGSGTSDMSWRLPAATISIAGRNVQPRAGDAYWSLSLPAGTYSATASAAGYRDASRSCSVSAGGEAWCSIGLVPDDGTAPDTDNDPADPGDDPADDPADPGDDPADDPADPGDDPADVDGEHGDFDFDAPPGLVEGYVIAATAEADFDACTGYTVGGAEVLAETGERTVADADGHFEFWVVPGKHLLSAEAEGFWDGAGECEVLSDSRVFCCIQAVPEDDEAELGDWRGDDPPGSNAGCATGEPGSALLLLPLLIGLLVRRSFFRRLFSH